MPSHPFPFGFKLANLDRLRTQVEGGRSSDIQGGKSAEISHSPVQIYPPPPSSSPVLNGGGIVVWRPALACAQTASKPLRAQRGGKETIERGNMVSAPSVLHYLALLLALPQPFPKKNIISSYQHHTVLCISPHPEIHPIPILSA